MFVLHGEGGFELVRGRGLMGRVGRVEMGCMVARGREWSLCGVQVRDVDCWRIRISVSTRVMSETRGDTRKERVASLKGRSTVR